MRISTEELTLQNGLKTFKSAGSEGAASSSDVSCLAEDSTHDATARKHCNCLILGRLLLIKCSAVAITMILKSEKVFSFYFIFSDLTRERLK